MAIRTMTPLTSMNMHRQAASPLREFLFSLIYPAVVLLVFIFLVLLPATAWINDFLKPVFSTGKALEVFAFHVTCLLYFGCAVLLSRILRGNFNFQGLAGGSVVQLAQCCVGVVLLFCLFQASLFLLDHPISQWEIDYVLSANQGLIVVFNTAFLVPLSEEIVYRGVLPFTLMGIALMLPRLFRKEPSTRFKDCAYVTGMVISCMIFAVLHHRGFVYDLYFFVLGLWFGYWAYKTSALIIPVIGHSLAGLLSVGTIYLRYA